LDYFENFEKYFLKEYKESFGIFREYSSFDMKPSKLINYLIDMC
jgi:hypothetical protein